MAKVSALKRIIKEDFASEDQNLVDKLAFPINSGFESISSALNKGLTFDDNFNAQLKEISVKVDATGKPRTTASFKSTLRTNVYGITCIRAISTNYVSGAPFVSFKEDSGVITIQHITGLADNVAYTLRLLIIGT